MRPESGCFRSYQITPKHPFFEKGGGGQKIKTVIHIFISQKYHHIYDLHPFLFLKEVKLE
jgi:hypothetical protein